METKRCAQCHKLLRADTQQCSRCGYTFVEKKRKTQDLTRPSLPPASPHRAGHYSGLHPEDQPYQSSMIAIQRPPLQEPEEDMVQLPEPMQEERIDYTLPLVEDEVPTKISVRYEKPPTEVGILNIQLNEPAEMPFVYHERPLLDTDSALPVLYQPLQTKKTQTTKRTISLLLTLSCVFFLLASGILVYVLISPKAAPSLPLQLTANPTIVRTGDTFTLTGKSFERATQVKFTYDDDKPITDSMKHQLSITADHQGMFSVVVITPADWNVGAHTIYATDDAQQSSTSTSITVEPPSVAPPHLQLVTTSIDLGKDRAGTTSSKQITLKNIGGGQITWQQKSDATWLTASPTSGTSYTFFGSTSVTITVNRSNLILNKAYTGHITFAQKDGSNKSVLTVTMSLDANPAALNVSVSSLTFAATNTQSVPTQSVLLQNSGGKTLDWQAATTANWLYLSSAANGSIAPAQSQQLVVGVQAQNLAAGLYQGAIVLTGGASATINVALTVIAPGNILVTPTTLTFVAFTGQSVPGKVLTLQNSGGQAQAWSESTSTSDSGNWLRVTPQSGSVGANTQASAIVNVSTTGLKAQVYQGTLTFTMGSQQTSLLVTLTLTTPPAAAIAVQSNALTFQTIYGNDPDAQMLAVTNTGNATLRWNATESGDGATFLPLLTTSGSLAPQGSVLLEISPAVSTYKPQTLQTTLTIADSDAGTTVVSQKVQITVVIQGQAAITASPSDITVTPGGTNPTTQSVTLTNSGNAPLDWSAILHIDAPVGGTWLSVDTTSGVLAPGESATLTISCDSTGLSKGTAYTSTIQFIDSDKGTPVAPQTVTITFSP